MTSTNKLPTGSMPNELSSFHIRESSCENGTYEHDTRLNFNYFCDLTFNGLNLPNGQVDADNATDCMWKCSNYSEASGCWGVSFSPPSTCHFKGKGISLDSSDPQSGSILGLVWPNSQMEPSSSMQPECGYPNGTVVQNAGVQDMDFEVFCNSDLEASAWVTGDLGTANEHFERLDECMGYCSDHGHPQCQAVVFDATMSVGYHNCFPKTVSMQNVSSSLVSQTDPPRHVAVAKIPQIDGSCVEGRIVASENKNYKLSCDQSISGDDIEDPFHANSLESCITECARHIGSTPAEDCVAVSWDPKMRDFYSNCYMKKSTGTPDSFDGMISAQITSDPITGNDTISTGTGTSTSTNNSSDGENDSNAWIAGAVIGPVVFIAILACLIWQYLRRRRTRRRDDQTGVDLHPVPLLLPDSVAYRKTTSIHEFATSNETAPVETDGQEIFEGGINKGGRPPIELDVPKQL